MIETKKEDIIQVTDTKQKSELQRLLVRLKLAEDAKKLSNN